MDVFAQTLSNLDRLVECPTVPGEANSRINDYVASTLSASGVKVARIPSPLGDVEGLVASIGPDAPGGIILSGHSDVVSVEGQDWSGDPFLLRRNGNRLYGRGTTDMKGFVACAMALMQSADSSALKAPVYLFLSVDEETTCQSVQTMIAHAKAHLPPARGVVVGEPTMMHPVDLHKASATHRVEVNGRSIHASIPHKGVSATSLAARLVTWLDQETAQNARSAKMGCFDPNYSTHTVGILNGGISGNTVAGKCCFTWDMRLMPHEDHADVIGRFDAYAKSLIDDVQTAPPAASILRKTDAFFPGLTAMQDGAFRDELCRLSQMSQFGSVPYGTEAGFFQQSGFDTIILGPGNIAQAHTADEFVDIEQLEICLNLTNQLIL